jgi:hypothetical protein
MLLTLLSLVFRHRRLMQRGKRQVEHAMNDEMLPSKD